MRPYETIKIKEYHASQITTPHYKPIGIYGWILIQLFYGVLNAIIRSLHSTTSSLDFVGFECSKIDWFY